MQDIFEENKTNILKGALVWTPMLFTDGREAAEKHERVISDPRIQHYWDPDRTLGRLISRSLHLKTSIAWDVYLIYPPDHIWDAELPPMPAFWMHQLDEEPSLLLDPPALKKTVQAMIERFSTR